jgi:hypothetical protein
MSQPKPAFTPDPRIWTQFQVACRLNRSEQWLMSNRRALEQTGFPKKIDALRGWDSNAIEAWLDKLSGVIHGSNIEEQMLEIIHGENKPPIRAKKRLEGACVLPLPPQRPVASASG